MNLRRTNATHPDHLHDESRIHTNETPRCARCRASSAIAAPFCYWFCNYRIALTALTLLALTAGHCQTECVERAAAQGVIPIIGAPSPEAEATVNRALAAFTPEELDSVRAVHFAEAGGTLRGFDNGWAITDRAACAEAWGVQMIAVIRDRPDCMALLGLFVTHEFCHLATADYTHGPVWQACMWR